MQWREVDDRVANRCVISFSGNSPLFEYSRAHNLYAPVIMRRIDGSLFPRRIPADILHTKTLPPPWH